MDNHTRTRIALGLVQQNCRNCKYGTSGGCKFPGPFRVTWPCYDGGPKGYYPGGGDFIEGMLYWEPIE
jgi:hypothetical protein